MFDYINTNGNDFTIFLVILLVAVLALVFTRKLLKLSFPYFFMGLLGLMLGLLIGSLITTPLTKLPGEYGRWIPIAINIFVAVAVLDLFLAQAQPVSEFFSKIISRFFKTEGEKFGDEIVVDTSVLIDGRIQAIAETGFLLGKLNIPRFVLEELQTVADSEDPLKRSRGRRGLEVLTALQKNNQVFIEISDVKPSSPKVDQALLVFAKEKKAKILTVDYNLNRIAQIENIAVLNINELAEAIKPVLIPGEEINVKVIQKGKEKNQGVGYLADGTMIVVEGGSKFVGETINCEVVRIFHTVAGKMIFVEPRKAH